MLEIHRATKKFNFPVFKEVSLEANYGDIIQINGPNGVGKTTLLKGLAGFLSLESEGIKFNNRKLHPTDTVFITTDERCFFPRLTVLENIHFFQKFYQSKIETKIWIQNLELTEYLDVEFQRCSTGYKKRLAIIRGILKSSKIFLFDEPFANMDPVFKKKLEKLIFNEISTKTNIIIFTSNTIIENKNITKCIQLMKGE